MPLLYLGAGGTILSTFIGDRPLDEVSIFIGDKVLLFTTGDEVFTTFIGEVPLVVGCAIYCFVGDVSTFVVGCTIYCFIGDIPLVVGCAICCFVGEVTFVVVLLV